MGLHLKIQQPNQADNTAYLETFDSYTSFSPLHPPVEDEGGGVFKDNAPSIITHSAWCGVFLVFFSESQINLKS
jgi:hypothetical protein